MTTAIHDDRVELARGETIEADLVIVAAGVVPEADAGAAHGRRRSTAASSSTTRCAPTSPASGRSASAPSTAGCSSAWSRRRWRWRARRAPTSRARPPRTCRPARHAPEGRRHRPLLLGRARRRRRGRRARHPRRPLPPRGLPRRASSSARSSSATRPRSRATPDADPARLRLQRRHPPRDPRLRRHRPRGRQARDPREPPAAAAARRGAPLLDEAAEVGFQAVQVEPAKAIEVLVRGPVEVGRAGRQ